MQPGRAPNKPRLERRPEAVTLPVDDLIQQVLDGIVRVPAFQRPMKWGDEDRKDLLDSLLRGFPIGDLLLWKRDAPAEEVALGDLRLPVSQRSDAKYVVDGQQRITTLAQAALLDPLPGERGLHLDLNNEDFVWERLPRSGAPLPTTLVPVRALFDTERLTDWILANSRSLPPEQRRTAIEAGKRLREYRVPAYIVETSDTSTLRSIFERVNRAGKRLTDAEVFHALYVVGDRSTESLRVVQDSPLVHGWGSLKEELALNIVRAIAGIPLRKSLPADLETDVVQRAVQRARIATSAASAFLKHMGGIPHVRLMPYMLPIIVLARFFDAFPSPSERSTTLLRRWLWRGLASLSLSGATVNLRRHLQSIVHGNEHASVQNLLSLASDRGDDAVVDLIEPDRGTAATKIQLCALAARSPLNARTGFVVAVDSLCDGDTPTLTLVVGAAPRSLAAEVLHPPSPRDDLLEGFADERVAASHLVTPEAWAALTAGDPQLFMTLRTEAMRVWIGSYLDRMAEWGADDSPPLSYLAGEDDA